MNHCRKTDVEIIPEVVELRGFMRNTKLREGKLVVKDLLSYVNSLKRMIPIYQDLKGREHYRNTVRYVGFKLEMVINVLKNNYGIDVYTKEK